jgi:hypothetical protein
VVPVNDFSATILPRLQQLLGSFGIDLAVVEAGKDIDLLPIA